MSVNFESIESMEAAFVENGNSVKGLGIDWKDKTQAAWAQKLTARHRYKNDAEYRQKRNTTSREYWDKNRENLNLKQRDRYATDEEYREKRKKYVKKSKGGEAEDYKGPILG